MSHSNDYTFKD